MVPAVQCPSCTEPRCPWGMEKSWVWLLLARRYLAGSSRFVAGGGAGWVLCAPSPGSAHVAGAEQGKEGRGGGWPPAARDPAPSTGPIPVSGAVVLPGVQQRPPGSFPMGELCPGAGSQPMSALCPFTTELCGCSVGPCAEPLWLSTMSWQRVLVGHRGLPGELWPGTEGPVRGCRQGAGCRKGRSRPRVCLLEDLAPGPCPWGCSRPMLPCLCRCSDGHHGHQQGEV